MVLFYLHCVRCHLWVSLLADIACSSFGQSLFVLCYKGFLRFKKCLCAVVVLSVVFLGVMLRVAFYLIPLCLFCGRAA